MARSSIQVPQVALLSPRSNTYISFLPLCSNWHVQQYTINREYFIVKIFLDSQAYAKIKCPKTCTCTINSNAV